MPAWPGGPCPTCGEDMPENLIHCYNCRALLNNDLESDSVEIPRFIPLQEIAVMLDVAPAGYYIACPRCDKELRVSRKYVGEKVLCKHCSGSFSLDISHGKVDVLAYYAPCPACSQELRASKKYLGQKVACKHCTGQLRFVE